MATPVTAVVPLPTIPATPTVLELVATQSKSDDENISKTAFCKLEIGLPIKDTTDIVLITLDKVIVTLEKKIDGTETKVAGIKISPYPNYKPSFTSDVKASVTLITYVIAKVFELLSTEPNSSITPIEKQLKSAITRNFGSEKIEFIVFKDRLIQLSSLSHEDQRTEIVKIFTPFQERPSTVARGNLNFDKEFFSDTHIALYYDIALQPDLDKLETGITPLFTNVRHPVDKLNTEPNGESEDTKNESKTIMSFRQFSTRLLPEAVATDLAKSIESTVKQGLTSISYDPVEATVFTPPIDIEFPLKWDTIKTLTLTDQQKTEFNTVFNNPDYSVLVDGKDVTVTPSTFTFNL